MKINCFCVLFSFFTFFISSQATAQLFLQVQNLKSDTLIIVSVPVSNPQQEHVDTVVLRNHRLVYAFAVKELSEFAVIPFSLIHQFKNGNKYPLPGSRIKFFAAKGDKINIIAKITGHTVTYQAQGNALSIQFSEAHNMKHNLFELRYSNEIFANQKESSLLSEDEKRKIQDDRIKNNRLYEAENIKFAKAHPDYVISPRLLLEVKNKDSVIYCYAKLNKLVKESYFGNLVGDNIKGWMASIPGRQMPNLQTTTIQGKSFQLNELKGKYVLLDFWGSWCTPCIAEIPSLKALEKLNKEKLAIVGLICKDQRANALNVINKYKITTTQLYSSTTNYGMLFGVRDYPSKILLDKNGVVVRVFTGYSETNFAEIQKLIQ
jgi:thiol-disulfide isomerase/thioredoxin